MQSRVDAIDTVWTTTKAHETVATFGATTRADSTHFADWHTFYANAIDNHGAAFDRAVLFCRWRRGALQYRQCTHQFAG